MGERYGNLLRGGDPYTGDLDVPGLLHLVFVRSPVAHALVRRIDTAAARRSPGVVAVLTADDLDVAPLRPLVGGPELAVPPLAAGVVRHLGERVAAVVAATVAAAEDAAELVAIDYEELPAVADPEEARRPGSPLVFPERGTNVVLELPHEPAGEAEDAADDVVVRARYVIPRVAVSPMEGHAVLAVPDPAPGGRLTVWLSTQVPHSARSQLAACLGWPVERLRVVTPRVGGGFGGKAGGGVPEHVVVVAAADRLGRPVRWVETRAENLAGMHGRGVRQDVELRARRDGTLVRLRAEVVVDAGAYPGIGAIEPVKMRLMASGPYRIPAVDFRACSVLTHRVPTGAYRGPGRSEAATLLERTMDLLAAELGMDPVELRRRNLLRADELPCTTPTGMRHDGGDHHRLLGELLLAAGYDELRAEQRRRRAAGGPLLGIGVATVVDSTAWAARRESAHVAVRDDGTVTVAVATASAGQEHGAAFAQLVAALLPVEPGDVAVVEGDTDALPNGDGTMGSRSVQLAGTAVHLATREVAEQARRLAAQLLEASVEDVVVHPGRGFGVQGVPATALALAELAARAGEAGDGELAAGAEAVLEARCAFEQSEPTHPAAAHLAVVEVDPETGRVTPVRHVVVTDAGTVLDPPSAGGQVVGATVQGIGQALYEEVAYDEDGQLQGASLAEYLVPSAADVPPVTSCHVESPSPLNPLGAKGIGEIGMVAAPAAVQNAVVDALAHLGVRHVPMPCTPERVWRALAGARARA